MKVGVLCVNDEGASEGVNSDGGRGLHRVDVSERGGGAVGDDRRGRGAIDG